MDYLKNETVQDTKDPPRKAGMLGEIVNPAAISTYFTEQSGVYF
jgi:hypothetical protein